jgi:filamentous hemagglutinin family protein
MATSCLVSALAVAQPAAANPSGATVVAGQAAITQSAQSTLVQQQTQKAIITWQSLNLASGQNLTFAQPNAQAITLNRVLSNSGTVINGNLSANGQVWLINPNGVLFGAGAQVNVGGLLATTSDIANQDFLSGTYKFALPSVDSNASIVNQGHITALNGGSVVLAGNAVANQGVIEAQLGSVVLGGAKTYTVDFYGDKLLSFAIDGGVDTLPKDANGNPVGWAVSNSGTIAAQGGQVTMTARAANQLLDHLINMSGEIQATGVSVHNGTVVLDAGEGGDIDVSGKIDASGAQGGGSVKVGSAKAGTVTIENSAVIDVSSSQGNAGSVETSGHDLKLGSAAIDLAAPLGKAGKWLLDPVDFVIDSTNNAAIDAALNAGGSVTISAGASATATGVTAASGSGGSTAGDIFVNAAIGWTGSGSLTLDAYNNISVNSSISRSGATAAGGLSLITGDTAGNGTSSNSSSDYIIGSGASITLGGTDTLSINGASYSVITAFSQVASSTTNYALANSISATSGFAGT